jgi:hypothetical protein
MSSDDGLLDEDVDMTDSDDDLDEEEIDGSSDSVDRFMISEVVCNKCNTHQPQS